jgi:nucleotide-binding universal stress UspA family protein
MTGATKQQKKIVVGIDGSEESFAALAWAIDDAERLDATINAVYGWTPSWEVGAEPDSKEAWDSAYQLIEGKISAWVQEHYPHDKAADTGEPRCLDRIILTSVRGSGQAALLTLGASSSCIIVGRRNLNSILRWFLGSTSASLAQAAKVPVTIVKTRVKSEVDLITQAQTISSDLERNPLPADGNEFSPSDVQRFEATSLVKDGSGLPIVVGIDGSSDSIRALTFAVDAALRMNRHLHILFCWQMRDLGVIPEYENAIAPLNTAQAYASDLLARSLEEVSLPENLSYDAEAFHIPAVKGLTSASKYAHWLIIGSRGLSGIDARVLGSVSSRLVDASESTLTVVH